MKSRAQLIIGCVAIVGALGCNEYIDSGSGAVDPIVAGLVPVAWSLCIAIERFGSNSSR